MTWPLVFGIVFVVLVLAALCSTHPATAASAERLARRVNLQLDDVVRPQVQRFERRRVLGTGIGAALGATVAALLTPAVTEVAAFAIMIGMFGGTAVGAALAALVHLGRPQQTDAATAARLSPVDVDDLVPRSERYGMRYVAVGAAAATLTALALLIPADALLPSARPTVIATVVLLAIGVISVIGWEILARRIARSRPVSGDVQALAWSDALRSLTLRDMVTFPLAACLYSPLTLLTATTVGAVDSMVRTVVGFALGLIVIVAAVVAITAMIMAANSVSGRHPAQHYQRRLWPEISVWPGASRAAAATSAAGGARSESGES